MSCFVDDGSLPPDSYHLLRRATTADPFALRASLESLYPLALAVCYDRTSDFGLAERNAMPVLQAVFTNLMHREILPHSFREAIGHHLDAHPITAGEAGTDGNALHSLHQAGKLQRRRAAVGAMDGLSLAAKTALVLRYHARWPIDGMVGIVAPTEADVSAILVDAHRRVIEAMQEIP